MGRAGPKGYQQVFIHTPHSGAATLEALLNQQRNTFVGIGIGAGVCPLNSGLAFTPQTGRHFLFGPPFFLGGSLVSWSAQADHCGMITCERFVPTPPCTLLPGKQYCRSTWDAGPRGYQQVFIHN